MIAGEIAKRDYAGHVVAPAKALPVLSVPTDFGRSRLQPSFRGRRIRRPILIYDSAMKDFEKLGLFYLGREYDVASGKVLDTPSSTTPGTS